METEEQRIAGLQRLRPLLELVVREKNRYLSKLPGVPHCTTLQAYKSITDFSRKDPDFSAVVSACLSRNYSSSPFSLYKRMVREDVLHRDDYQRLLIASFLDKCSWYAANYQDLVEEIKIRQLAMKETARTFNEQEELGLVSVVYHRQLDAESPTIKDAAKFEEFMTRILFRHRKFVDKRLEDIHQDDAE